MHSRAYRQEGKQFSQEIVICAVEIKGLAIMSQQQAQLNELFEERREASIQGNPNKPSPLISVKKSDIPAHSLSPKTIVVDNGIKATG
jgi:hypothetical protein